MRLLTFFLVSPLLLACGGSTGNGTSGTGGTGGSGGVTGGSGGVTGGSGGVTGGSGGVTGGSGGVTGGSGGVTGGSGGIAGSGGGGGPNSGECTSDADCSGGTCVELSPGGFRACKHTVSEATACTSSGMDECCSSSDCSSGKCYLWPPSSYCGGAMPLEHNVCSSDNCSDSSACSTSGSEGLCIPGGVWGNTVSGCMPVACQKDSECTAEAGGKCLPLYDMCCSTPQGLYCDYPSNGCSTHPCGSGEYCGVAADPTHGGQVTEHCIQGFPGCPA